MNRLSFTAFGAAATCAASLALVPAAAAAQQIEGPQIAAGATLLTVTAEGETTSAPDLAVFSAGVATTGKTAGEALSSNSDAMNRVVRALKIAGIANRDIQTSNIDVSPVYSQRPHQSSASLEEQMPDIIGYRASNQVTVRQRKLDQFGKVIDTLVSSGANQVNGPSFQLNDNDTALNEARRDAMVKARERAQLYASAAGLRVTRILAISESGGYSAPRPMFRTAMADAASPAPPPPVQPGEVSLNMNVTVSFELAP